MVMEFAKSHQKSSATTDVRWTTLITGVDNFKLAVYITVQMSIKHLHQLIKEIPQHHKELNKVLGVC